MKAERIGSKGPGTGYSSDLAHRQQVGISSSDLKKMNERINKQQKKEQKKQENKIKEMIENFKKNYISKNNKD